MRYGRRGLLVQKPAHFEIQGSYEKEFSRRMFDYNTTVYKLYNREVVSLAVLCDERPNWRPKPFGYGRWGSRTEITFPFVKLLDYAGELESLEKDQNPFAVVVLAHLRALATRGDDAQRRAWKLRLVKGLYERKLTKDDVRELFRLLDWILPPRSTESPSRCSCMPPTRPPVNNCQAGMDNRHRPPSPEAGAIATFSTFMQ